MKRNLSVSVTGTTGVRSVSVDDDYSQPTKTATVEASNTSLDLGDWVEIQAGYAGLTGTIFAGYVQEIETQRTATGYLKTIRARDQLWRAVAMFIASDDPQSPLSYSNIAAEDLVASLLQLSGITSYDLDSPGFTFAPEKPLEVQLVSAWDEIERICKLIAWHCYDDNGTVRFLDRKPYNVSGDTASFTIVAGNSGTLVSVQPYSVSSDKIRNKVVVYGDEGVHATAQAGSPYLPPGFYKAEVIAAPDLIDNSTMAQRIADYNLEVLNRLEKQASIQVEGHPGLKARITVEVTESGTGMDGLWFVYSCRHNIGDTYTCDLTLVQRQT